MTDKKKSDTASEESGRSEEETAAASNEPENVGTVDEARLAETGDVPDGIVDAEVIAEIPAEDDQTRAEGDEVKAEFEAEDLSDEPDDPQEIAELEVLDGVEAADAVSEGKDASDDLTETREEAVEPVEEDVARADEPAPSRHESREPPPPEPEPERAVETETVVVERRGAALPGFLGGAIAAAGMVFALPYVIPPKYMPTNPALEQSLADQAATIATLRDQIGTLEGKLAEAATAGALAEVKSASETALANLSAEATDIRNALDSLSGEISSGAAFQSVTERLEAMAAQVDELEKRPIAEATDPASIAAVQAYGRELADLRATVEAQMAQAETLVREAAASAESRVTEALDTSKAAQEKAAAETAAAAEMALQADRAQALVDIQAALEDGSPYADILPALDGIDLPAPLLAAADEGVATLAALREEFTQAAREALAVSRTEASDGSPTGRAATWLQNQLGVRSLAPSEGDDPDAVLSRAEAALGEGRISDAVAELSGLPAGGQQIMADWVAHATTRAEALAAADELAASLATN